ncbi:MAG: flagellin [Synergistaceae bacterium]|nr:flagellin [Synergistaceae bacterium]
MSMIMNHDMTSLLGQRIMQRNSLAMKRSLEKLSSGLRTKIADMDSTAELAIGETMRSRIFGMEKALNNSQDGVSMIQTAVGGLSQTQSMLNRMRELSVQAANDALTQQDRSYIQVEINEIRDHIDLIGNSTQFNRRSLLNGDSAILWSSSDNNVKAIVNGGLRSIDQYGQKYSVDGNFKLTIETRVGQAQTQKSNIFAIKHDNTTTSKTISTALGVDDVYATGSTPPGTYNMTLSSADGEAAKFTGSYKIGEAADVSKANVEDVFTLNASDGLVDNASILFEVKTINRNTGTVTLRATADIMNQDGATSKAVLDNIMLAEDGEEINLTELFGSESLSIGLSGIDYISDGAAFTVSVSAQSPVESAVGLDISGTVDGAYYDKWDGAPFHNEDLHYVLNGDHIAGKELRFTNFIINEKTGDISEGNIYLKTGATFRDFDSSEEGTLVASLKTGFISEAATGKTKLKDIDKFWDSQGNFLIDEPKEITLTQGDGKQAKAMLYADDTIDDVVRKFNSAIATGLGQANYVDDASKFVSFVEGQTAGAEAVAGTLVMRSVLTGKRGEITMSGNEELLKAFGLNTIQESVENRYGVTVRNAHDNSLIAERVEVAGNRLIGAIHKNVDVEFEPMLGVTAAWDDTTKNFKFTDSLGGRVSEVTLHLADNTTIIQTGAGEGEDVMVNIGDMRSHALGLDGVNVMSLEDAMHSVAIIDLATDKVSMQMAKLGASQNRLEHHIGNLTDEMQALIDANSTIRDTDYAKEMVEFTKIKILMESNSAMLAQSNAIQSQSILNLMR